MVIYALKSLLIENEIRKVNTAAVANVVRVAQGSIAEALKRLICNGRLLEEARGHYWAMDRREVERLTGQRLEHFRACMDETFWESITAMLGVPEACNALQEEGLVLVSLTALVKRF
ncbi:MAG: hypothetical protein CFE43_17910 [Burkholderiales bacterium PBB3]|nr:MAG: hypothetical protein CFE43_17910 [Burkholderiales bacterium PBB3]